MLATRSRLPNGWRPRRKPPAERRGGGTFSSPVNFHSVRPNVEAMPLCDLSFLRNDGTIVATPEAAFAFLKEKENFPKTTAAGGRCRAVPRGGGDTLSPSPKLSRPRGSSRSKFANSFHLAALLRFQKGFGARLLPRLFGFPPTGKSPRVNKKDAVDAGKKKKRKRKGVRCCRAPKEQAQDKRDKLRGKAKGEFPLCLFAPGMKGTLWSCRDRTAVFAHQSRPRPPLASCPLLDVRGVEGRFDSVQQSTYSEARLCIC